MRHALLPRPSKSRLIGTKAWPLLLLISISGCSVHKYVASTHPNGNKEVVIYMKGDGDQAEKVMEKVY